jgi:hypothetical protein
VIRDLSRHAALVVIEGRGPRPCPGNPGVSRVPGMPPGSRDRASIALGSRSVVAEGRAPAIAAVPPPHFVIHGAIDSQRSGRSGGSRYLLMCISVAISGEHVPVCCSRSGSLIVYPRRAVVADSGADVACC